MNIHNKNSHPRQVEGEQFSVDVITCDSDGLLNLAFYNYDTMTWSFHTDTLSDYTDVEYITLKQNHTKAKVQSDYLESEFEKMENA